MKFNTRIPLILSDYVSLTYAPKMYINDLCPLMGSLMSDSIKCQALMIMKNKNANNSTTSHKSKFVSCACRGFISKKTKQNKTNANANANVKCAII